VPNAPRELDLSYYGDRAARFTVQLQTLVPILSQVHGIVTYMADHAAGLTEALGGMTGEQASAIREKMEKTRCALIAVDMDIEATMHSIDAAFGRAQATVQAATTTATPRHLLSDEDV